MVVTGPEAGRSPSEYWRAGCRRGAGAGQAEGRSSYAAATSTQEPQWLVEPQPPATGGSSLASAPATSSSEWER